VLILRFNRESLVPVKIIISKKTKEIEFSGILKKNPKNNFIYLDIPNKFLDGIFEMLDEDNAEKEPGSRGVGSHISVIDSEEYEENKLEIKELGKEFSFTFGNVVSLNPEGWDEMERVWFLQAMSKELEKLRKSYGLTPLLNGNHEFHISFATQEK